MNLLTETAAVPILVTVWHEDDVWNFSAIDVQSVAYGDTVEDARSNFQEAVDSHVQALAHFGQLQTTVDRLRTIVEDQNFYQTRIKPGTMVEQFFIPQADSHSRIAA